MTSLLVGLGALVSVAALLHRPPRTGRLRRAAPRREPIRPSTLVAGVGHAVRRSLGFRTDPAADRVVGTAMVVALVAVVAGIEVAVLGVALLVLRRRWKRIRAHQAIATAGVERDLPDLIDLLALAVGAGLSLPAALPVVAPVAPRTLRDDLQRAVDGIAGGRTAEEAVVELGHRWGPPARPLVHALADHLRYGTPVLPALERVGVEARAGRRRAAEVRARRLPVLLLFPLVLCTLPAFGLLTVAPLIAGTFDALSGSHLEAPASTGP